jgi:enterochelin esterase-like enzyme
MNLDILSLNLALYVCILFTALGFYIVSSLYKPDPHQKLRSKKAKAEYVKKNRLQAGAVILFAVILAVILHSLVSYYTDSPIPASFILMCLPFTASIGTLVLAVFVKKRLRLVVGAAMVLGLLFSLIIINDYYRYNPTLGDVFGKTNAQELNSNLNNVTVNYTVSTNQQSFNTSSLQGSLDKLNNTPTKGKLYQVNIPGKVSKFKARPGFVYIPAIYNELPQINLPVIVLIAGVPGRPIDWVGLGLQNIMDQFAKNHGGISPLVFVVDATGSMYNDTECVNGPSGNAETYLTVDVPNYINNNFRVDNSPKNWAIGGLSLGGMCGLMLTLRHPNIYNYFIDLGGEIGPEIGNKQQTIDGLFGGSEQAWAAHQPSLLLENHTYKNIGGFFGDGAEDSRVVTAAIGQLGAESKKAGISSVTEIINGAHTFNVWAQTYKDALPWISNRIGATQCSSSCI